MEKAIWFQLIMEKVFVHKPYIISSLGLGLDENTEKLFSGQSGSKLINTPKYYPSAFFGSEIIQERFQDFFQKEFPQLVEKHPFFEQLLIYSIQQSIKNIDLDITTKDTLLIISSTKGNIDLLSKSQQNKWESDRVYLWKSAQIIQKFFGLKNKVMVLSNACISGIEAIAVGSRMIRSGNYKQVIVAGADILSEFVVSGFQSFQSLSPTLCAPYDKDRVGLNLGEAAGSLLLTSSEYESDIEVLGSGISNDANHISGPSRTGEGLFLAIKSALAESKLNAEDISFISGHGTATSYNDEMESKAFELANLDQTPINSLKGYWGHTLGAAGLIEAIASFASLRQNKLIKTLGYQNHGVSVEIPVIRETTEQINNTFLKTASGFGGANAAIIFKKNENDV